MGSALSQKVDSILRDFVEVGHSSGSVGLRTTSYIASMCRLRPQPLEATGLRIISGGIDSLEVSVETLGTLTSVLTASAPPAHARLRGLRLRLGALDTTPASSAIVAAAQRIEEYLGGLEVEIQDAVVELELAGHLLRVRADSLTARPRPAARAAWAAWRAEHRGFAVELDGRRIAWLHGQALGEASLRRPPLSTSVALSSKAAGRLEVPQLLALLEVAASLQALVAASAASAAPPPGPWDATFAEVSLELALEPLLRLSVARGAASMDAAGAWELALLPLAVGQGAASELRLRLAPGGPARLQHCFDAPPWRGAVEAVLAAAPPSAPYRPWLEAALDGFASTPGVVVSAPSRKRAREAPDDGAPEPPARRSRL